MQRGDDDLGIRPQTSSSVSVSVQKEWYKVRDVFFGENKVSQNIALALELAALCDHDDARWLSSVCGGKGVANAYHAKQALISFGENDARALCFTWCLLGYIGQLDLSHLQKSAELGFAFAQVCLGWQRRDKARFELARLAAAQHERDGFFLLADCFLRGEGCEKDAGKARQNFLISAELGSVNAMNALGTLLDESNPQKWRWWGLAAKLGDSFSFLNGFAKQVERFHSGTVNAVVFTIGEALKGHMDIERCTIFGAPFADLGPANRAIAFYDMQIKACFDAIRAWTQVGIRLNVVKDIRIIIGKRIWEARGEGKYLA